MSNSSPSDEAVRAATGRGWQEWHAVLDALGAAQLPHRDIAARLATDHGVADWWAQTITVEYERSVGRRDMGQRCDGAFTAGATKTLPQSIDDALAAWERLVAGRTEFDGVAITGAPRITRTDRWRYWRVNLADGSRLAIVIGAKPGATPKAGLAVNHEGVPSKAAAERWKAYWKDFLRPLA